MSLLSSVAVYFVLWWLCLFVMLPFAVGRDAGEEEEREAGTDPGAPLRPRLLLTVLGTTALSAIIFACVYLYFGVYEQTLQDLLL
jgi:predicted secreted protein